MVFRLLFKIILIAGLSKALLSTAFASDSQAFIEKVNRSLSQASGKLALLKEPAHGVDRSASTHL